MLPLILVSTQGGLTYLTFTDPIKADGYCARMKRLGIAYEMEVF